MTQAEIIDRAAMAMWALRAIPEWRGMGWTRFCQEKPEIAKIYRENASAAVHAIQGLREPHGSD